MFLPSFADIDVTRRARLLLLILLTFLLADVGLLLLALLLPVMQPVVPTVLGFGVMIGLLLGILRLGYVRLTAVGLIGAMVFLRLLTVAMPAIMEIPGMDAAMVLNSAVIILLSGFLVGWWSPFPVALVIVGGQVLMNVLMGPSVVAGSLVTGVMLLALCVFVSLFARSLERALAYARQQESTAQAAMTHTQTLNQELVTTLHDTQALLDQERTLRDTISQLTVPIQEVSDGVLYAPLIGHIDTERGEQISKTVLDQIYSARARTVIFDVQGISVIDSGVVTLLDRLIQAAQLLGARVMMTGVSAAMAATMTRLGITFGSVSLHTTVATALQVATAAGASSPMLRSASVNGKTITTNGAHLH